MRRIACIFVVSLFAVAPATLGQNQTADAVPQKSSASGRISNTQMFDAYGRLPLNFEANEGQSSLQVKFVARGLGYALFLTQDGAVLSLQDLRNAPAKGEAFAGSNALLPEAKELLQQPQKPHQAAASVLRMQVVGANAAAEVIGARELRGKNNYFIGNNPKKWHTDVPTFAEVKYRDIYPGVDLVYYGNQGQLEYDFVVAPGASLKQVRLAIAGEEISGADQQHKSIPLHIGANGDLVAMTAKGEVRYRQPIAYQPTPEGRKHIIRARFILKARGQVRFAVGSYDHHKVLVMDPQLVYSTYVAAPTIACCPYTGDQATGIAVDSARSAYITGLTISADFPIITGAYQTICKPSNNGCTTPGVNGAVSTVFVSKLSADGSSLVYSTYIGGSYGDQANAIAVDSSGNAYIAGQTLSPDFPTTAGAYQRVCGPRLDQINTAYCYGSHIISTCGINAAQNGFVTKLNSTGSALVYSTFLGGSSLNDTLNGIAVDSAGEAYVIGRAQSNYSYSAPGGGCGCPLGPGTCDPNINVSASYGYPITPGGFYPGPLPTPPSGYIPWPFGSPSAFTLPPTSVTGFPSWGPGGAAVLSKLSADGSTLLYSTYFGGGYGPVLAGGDQWGHFQTLEPFLTQGATAIAIDSSGDAYVAGYSNASDLCCTQSGGSQYASLPTTPGVFQPHNASACGDGGFGCFHDAFVAKFDPSQSRASSLIYSTYLGSLADDFPTAIAADSAGNAYVAGTANTTAFGNGPNITPSNFPTTPGTLQPNCPGNCNSSYGWVAKLNSAATALDYSTFVSGTTSSSNAPNGIAADSMGNAYVAGQTSSTDFPQQNPLQGFANAGSNAFLSVLNPSASSLLFSTLLGGASNGGNGAAGVALDSSDNIFVAGFTQSSSFPTTQGAFQPTCAKCATAPGVFVAEISAVAATVTPATVTLGNLSYTYDGALKAATATTNPPGLTVVSITYTGTGSTVYGPSLTPPTNAGSYSVDASLNNPNYQASDAVGTLVISPANQTVSFPAIGSQTYGNPPFTIRATASSGLPGSFSVSGNCSLAGTTVAITGAGSCAITASQPGNANYSAAISVSQTVTIASANQTISWPTPANIVYGTALSGTQLNATVSVPGSSPAGAVTYSPAAGTILGPGSGQTLGVSVAGTANYSPASATVKINVLYAGSGLCDGDVGHAILPPINADGSSVWKQGSTVPIKFRVCDINGVSIGTAGVVTNLVLYKIGSGTIAPIDETAVNSTNDLAWHFDATGQQWIFNLSTKTAPQNVANQTYYYRIDLNDGTNIYFQFGLR
ncbi:MAG TPA: SBBP repeat-containing protein [Candidatus Acidoferrum sp.]|nr:SBBP repeat-containing protein [Candidatus Acidoferrum sp.]